MKKSLLPILIVFLTLGVQPLFAQQQKEEFTGAKANLKKYKALYVLNNGEEKHMNSTLRNMRNVLADPRLKGKLTLELVVFGDGVKVFDKTGPFETQLADLQKQGVILAQCENTLRERKIDKSTLFPFINFVPSGNGEIVIRSADGWVIVHP
jgi:intracellular sulfur oxidation DsrE/DsrF family protein